MRLTDIRESDGEPRKTKAGGTVKKTPTGLVHTLEPDADEKDDKKIRDYSQSTPTDLIDPSDRGTTSKTASGTVHKAGNSYSGKRHKSSTDRVDGKQGSTLTLPHGGKLGGSRNSRLGEATGDSKFDSMMGKIAGSTTPVTPPSAASNKINDLEQNGPDMETINALNKMMYDMHMTMQTANQLMQKLMRGR